MLIDGNAVAKAVRTDTAKRCRVLPVAPKASVITCAPNAVTKRYLATKQAVANEVGIELVVHEYPVETLTEGIVSAIKDSVNSSDAIVVQLPLPDHVDTNSVLDAIPLSYDVDALKVGSPYLSPVVGSIKAIAGQCGISIQGQRVVVIGAGALVGRPAAAWSRSMGAEVIVVTKDDPQPQAIKQANIIIAGAGVPHLVQPDMISDGVVLFDAGTSEAGGVLQGDIAPECAQKASYMTPVPGGIGPVTIAMLMDNIVTATQKRVQKS